MLQAVIRLTTIQVIQAEKILARAEMEAAETVLEAQAAAVQAVFLPVAPAHLMVQYRSRL